MSSYILYEQQFLDKSLSSSVEPWVFPTVIFPLLKRKKISLTISDCVNTTSRLWTQLPPNLKGFTSPNCLMSISFPHLLPRDILVGISVFLHYRAHYLCKIMRGRASYCRISVFLDRCRRDSLRWQEASCGTMGSHSIDGHSQTMRWTAHRSRLYCTVHRTACMYTSQCIDGHLQTKPSSGEMNCSLHSVHCKLHKTQCTW